MVLVIPGCETSGRFGTQVHFSHILRTFWGSFARVSGGVGSCGRNLGFWGSHTRRVRLSLLQLRIFYRWCLLRVPFCAASASAPGGGHFSGDPSSSALSLTTLILLCSQAFLPLCHTPGEFFHWRFLPLF